MTPRVVDLPQQLTFVARTILDILENATVKDLAGMDLHLGSLSGEDVTRLRDISIKPLHGHFTIGALCFRKGEFRTSLYVTTSGYTRTVEDGAMLERSIAFSVNIHAQGMSSLAPDNAVKLASLILDVGRLAQFLHTAHGAPFHTPITEA